MNSFILLYTTNAEASKAMSSITKEEQQRTMITWNKWRESLGENIVNFGSMFFGGTKLSSESSTLEPTSTVMGYTLIQATDLDEAKKLTASHPFLEFHKGCEIEVHNAFDMPQM